MSHAATLGVTSLQGMDKASVAVSTIEGKPLMLYFSAHWCPPCRAFTPKLAEFYKTTKGKVEIVFISSDNTKPEFEEYFGLMPWLALPFDARTEKDVLAQKFKVDGIPMLVLIDAEGKVITTEGRAAVTADPTGAGPVFGPVFGSIQKVPTTQPAAATAVTAGVAENKDKKCCLIA